MGGRHLMTRAARWSATHPWWALTLWVVFVVGALLAGGAMGTQRAGDSDLAIGQSGRSAEIAKAGGLGERPVENVLVTPRTGDLDPAEAKEAAADAARRLKGLEEVAEVGAPVPAKDGSALLVPLTMKGDPEQADGKVGPLLNAVQATQDEFSSLRVELVGSASIRNGLNEMLEEDLGKANKWSLPLTLAVMLVVFGAIVAAGVPVLLGMSTVAAGLGLWGVVSHLVPDPGPVTHIIVLMGMAVGVDYSLFYIKRQREERALGTRNIDAIEIAAATSGHSVVISGLVVTMSMAALYFAGHVAFTSMATGAILVVLIAILASLTVLPALLSLLGRWLERPRVPLVWRLTNRTARPRLWPALLRPALRRPALALIVSVAALGALSVPALDLKLKTTGIDDLPRSITAMQGYDRMVKAFPSQADTHRVAVLAPADQAPRVRAALAALVERTSNDPLFTQVSAPEIRTSEDHRVSTVEIATRFDSSSGKARESLAKLREDLAPATVGKVAGAEFAVGGSDVAHDVDYRANVVEKMPWVLGFALLMTFLVMLVSYRSVLLAVVTVVLNILSAVASIGVLALVFQHTWAEGILHFESTGRVVAWLPLMLFVILLGLSMDYHVFVVSRIREAAQAGLPVRDAVETGIIRTAGVVTSAAVVMVSVFALFAGLSFIEMKQMGVGMAAAVLLDATLIRIVVLPSVVTLLGNKIWWPSRLGRPAPGVEPMANDRGAPVSYSTVS